MYDWIIDSLAETWDNIYCLLEKEPEASFDAQTPCPGWSVRDVLSHLSGFELFIRGGAVPVEPLTMPAYVRNSIGQINERFVAQRRELAGGVVLEEFRRVTDDSLHALRQRDGAAWDKIGWSPEGDVAFHRFQETRLLDSWIHLHDIRDALGLSGDVNGVGAEVVLNRFESALPYVVGKKARAPESATVRLNVSGPLARSVSLRVHNARAEAVSSLEQPPTVEMTMPISLFWRAMAGRINSKTVLTSPDVLIEGDSALAESIIGSMDIMI